MEARERYSEYVFRSILKEDNPEKGRLEHILYEFAGTMTQVDRSEIEILVRIRGRVREH